MRQNETMSDWIPVKEATTRYRLSRATLYRLISEGRVRRGKRAGDVRAYLSANDLKAATTIRTVAPRSRGARSGKRRPRSSP